MSGGGLTKKSTKCNTTYLTSGLNSLSGSSFCVGASYGGVGLPLYSSMSVYACRLYTRCLSTTEVDKNYHESVNYHNYLNNKN